MTETERGSYSVCFRTYNYVTVCVLHTIRTLIAIPVGVDAVSILSEMASQHNVQERFNADEETWPPDQPKNFTPLILVYHQGHHNMKQPALVAQEIQSCR